MPASLASVAPPGGRGAPGGEVPGGRSAPGGESPPAPPGGRPPRLNIGGSGGRRFRPKRPSLVPGKGQKQVIKTTVTVTPDRRAQLRDALLQYRKSRPDITNASKQSTSGYTAPKGMGRKMPVTRRSSVKQAGAQAAAAASGASSPPPQAASGAGTPPKAKKPRKKKLPDLGSPGHKQPEVFKMSDVAAGKEEDLEGYTAHEAEPNPATEEDFKRKEQLEKGKREAREEYEKKKGAP